MNGAGSALDSRNRKRQNQTRMVFLMDDAVMLIRPFCRRFLTPTLAALLALTVTCFVERSLGAEPAPVIPQQTVPGQHVFVCGHSFHVFIAEPIAQLAKEAGIEGHQNLGVDFIGNSRPIWHWNIADPRNKTKKAILAGNVDVLTLAPNIELPDEGVDHFADLAIEHNPHVRVMLQLSWPAFDGQSPFKFRNEDRDQVVPHDLQSRFLKGKDSYLSHLLDQVHTINQRHDRQFVYVVPAGLAVLKLREKVMAGEVPGIAHQSELFKDSIGHGLQPVRDLVTYCWFAAIYHRSPVGLTALDKQHSPESGRLQRLLQELAWETVVNEPASGATR